MASNLYYFKIESLCGEESDPKFYTDVLTDTAHEIINLLDPTYLYLFSSEVTDIITNGYKLSSTRLLNVSKQDNDGIYRQAKEVGLEYEQKIQNIDSVFYPSDREPLYFIKNNYIYVYGGNVVAASAKVKINLVVYPTVAYNDSSGTGVFPVELDTALVYGTAIRVRIKQLGNFTSTGIPTPPSFTQVETYIRTEEDTELAGSESGKISMEIQDYGSQVTAYGNKYKNMSLELAIFREKYQKALQPYIGAQIQGGPTAQAAGGAQQQ